MFTNVGSMGKFKKNAFFCGAPVNISTFSDTFPGSALDACKWVHAGAGTAVVSSNTLVLGVTSVGTQSFAASQVADLIGSSVDFDISVTISSAGSPSGRWLCGIEFLGADLFSLEFGERPATAEGPAGRGIWTSDRSAGTRYVLEESITSGGITDRVFRIARVGSTITMYVDGSSVRTLTDSSSVTLSRLVCGTVSTTASLSATFSDFTVS